MDTEAVKAYLSTLEWSLGTEQIASNVLDGFYKFHGAPFFKPYYRRVDMMLTPRGLTFRLEPLCRRLPQTA
jgi:hypothetical protein